MNDLSTSDVEFVAMQAVYKALESLDDDARSRVVEYITRRLEIATTAPRSQRRAGHGGDEEMEEVAQDAAEVSAPKFESLAELFDATKPRTNAERALVAGYWLQICKGAESFDGFSANQGLKHLGHGVGNITNAIDSLKAQKPALALQLKKSGTSRQARKTYKVTHAGIMAVEAMIAGRSA